MLNKSPTEEFLLLLVLATMQFGHVVDFMVLMPLGPQLIRGLQISPEQFGWLVSIYNFSAAIFGFIMAFYLDSMEKRKTLLTIFTGFLIATLFCGIANSFHTLLLGRAMVGAFGGILSALIYSIVADVVPEIRRGAAMGIIVSAFSVASILGLPIAISLANVYSWRAPFYVIFLVGLPIFFIAYKVLPILPAASQKRDSIKDTFKKVLFNKQHLKAFRLTTAIVASGFIMIPYISTYFVINGGVSEEQLPIVYLCGGAATLFTSRFFGALSDKYGRMPVFLILASISIFPALWIANFPALGVFWASIATSLSMIFNSGRMIIATTIITEAVDASVRTSFMSFNTCFQQLASSLASMLASQIIIEEAGLIKHFDITGYISCIMALMAMYFCYSLLKKPKPSLQPKFQ